MVVVEEGGAPAVNVDVVTVEALPVVDGAGSSLLCQSRMVVLIGLLLRACVGCGSGSSITVTVELGPMGGWGSTRARDGAWDETCEAARVDCL
jgi:hypothetical protein